MLEIPDIKAMYYRRLRTLHDTYLVGNGFVNAFDALTVGKDADRVLDKNKWGGPTLVSSRSKVVKGVEERRTQIAAHTSANEIPPSQSANPNIVFNEINYKPGPPSTTGDEEFLELFNPSMTEAVDISGWQIKGVGSNDGLWPIPNGTVVPKGGYVVVVSHDAAFRSLFGGAHSVGGQFPGGLSSSGEDIQLLDGARLVDEVNYQVDQNGWPNASGTGQSIELKDPALDNNDPTSWALSANNGTPGTQNVAHGGGGPGSVVLDFGATWKYLDTGVDQGTAWRAPGFNDSAWRSGPGPLGFRNKGTKTTLSRAQKRVTYYFRTTFNVSGTVSAATLNLVRDDGAVVYVNGVEVARSNMPAGTIVFSTKASAEVTGAAETSPVTITVPTGAFVTGLNTIAIEVHQIGNAAGDLGMDAKLSLS
jgi:hypothetical protein